MLATSGQLKRSDVKADESELLLKSLQATIAPKLVQSDRTRYDLMINNLFDSINLEKDPRVQIVIENAFETINLVKNTAQTTRVEQVVQLLTYMNGLIIVGPTGSGKSTVLKLYQE